MLNSGGIVADLLAANSYRNLVLPYEIEDNVLLLDSREIRRDSSVGLALEPPQNDCVLSTEQVSFISLGAHKQILRAKDKKQRLSILKRELSKKLDPRRFAIVLSATRKQAILFNAEKGQFQRVWPVNKRGASQTVCAIEPFDLESLV